jgi:hypothetical protein
MPQHLLHDLRVRTILQVQGRCCVSQIVKPDARQALGQGTLLDALPPQLGPQSFQGEHTAQVAPDNVVRMQRLSVDLAEDETEVMPGNAA